MLSGFEQAWAKARKRTGIIPCREQYYDPVTLLFYAPTEYEAFPLRQLEVTAPSREWVAQNFRLLARETSKSRGRCPPRPAVREEGPAAEELLDEYLEQCENQLVYSSLASGQSASSRAERILSVLQHPLVGNRDNKRYLKIEHIESAISVAEADKLPLQFVVPAFPFKDQNPFRTAAPPSHPDLGEVALIIRLHVLALALWQVYPFGAEWLIVSDGICYAPIFGVPVREARQYLERLRSYRNRLNLQKTIHILDLDEVTDRLGTIGVTQDGRTERDWDFAKMVRYLEGLIGDLAREGRLSPEYDELVRGMRWNIESRSYLEHYDRCDLWAALTRDAPRQPTRERAELIESVTRRSSAAAIEYAAYNLALRYLEVFETLLPTTIRATSHSKEGQVAIPSLGVSPWNAVAVLRDGPVGPTSVECRPLHELSGSGRWAHQGDPPFCYRRVTRAR